MAEGENDWIEWHNEELHTSVTIDGWRFISGKVTNDYKLFNLSNDP